MYKLHEDEAENHYLGQFIPLHYHHNMLMDTNRMDNFRAAIDFCVFEGAKVLELGGGTGVLSCLAAAKASKVWCVELNPDLINESKRFLALNQHGDKVEVVHADAFEYLPPEPVDVVICEMIHVAMLREKQVEMIDAFKQRYQARFGAKLPVFIPTAIIMALQPMQQDYNFSGFHAPIIQFQRVHVQHPGVELAATQTYSVIDFTQNFSREIVWQGKFVIEQAGTLNALRFFTKNILAVDEQQQSTIDWMIDFLVLPLHAPLQVQVGDEIQVAFSYLTGGSIRSLEKSLSVSRV